jgi:hypothetical protein
MVVALAGSWSGASRSSAQLGHPRGTGRRAPADSSATREARLSLTADGPDRSLYDRWRLRAIGHLQRASRLHEPAWLSAERYDDWARHERAREPEDSAPAVIPSSTTIRLLFDSWPNALLFAGLCTPVSALHHSRRGRAIDDDVRFQATADAICRARSALVDERLPSVDLRPHRCRCQGRSKVDPGAPVEN